MENIQQVKALIIDDEEDVCTFFRRLLSAKGYGVVTAMTERDATEALASHSFNIAFVDLKLPDTDGITLLQAIKGRQPACEVIIMTGYSTIKTAVAAVQLGAYEYIEKPFDDIDEIEALAEKAANRSCHLLHGQPAREEWAEAARAAGFQVGSSAAMNRLVSIAYKIANKNINVLIQGKTGTGKEVLARFVHIASARADAPFVAINCSALPENLLESELFGHERGAFTGAAQVRKGIFELANRGTLFLDEIGDASPMIQVKLLRVLETGEFMRVGGEKPVKIDVRVIAATNVDLVEAIRRKTFREDLYYRLNVVRLELPPLDARHDDIPLLAEHFARVTNPDLRVSPAALKLLQESAWPGNVRQLVNTIRRAAAMCSGDTILPEHLEGIMQRRRDAIPPAPEVTLSGLPENPLLETIGLGEISNAHVLERMSAGDLNGLLSSLHSLEDRILSVMRSRGLAAPPDQCLKDSEKDTVRKALERHGWNITETAKALAIGRNTLYRKIREFGLGTSTH